LSSDSKCHIYVVVAFRISLFFLSSYTYTTLQWCVCAISTSVILVSFFHVLASAYLSKSALIIICNVLMRMCYCFFCCNYLDFISDLYQIHLRVCHPAARRDTLNIWCKNCRMRQLL